MSKPYAFINDEMQNYSSLRDQMFSSTSAREKFDRVNPHVLNEVILPGQLLVVGHGSANMCTPEETELMYLARDVRHTLIGHDYNGNKVMLKNYDMLQSIMSYGSIGIGSSTAAWSKHLKGVEDLLKEIEGLHNRWRSSGLTNDQFFAERKALFSKLDIQLKGIGRFGTGLKNKGKIKDMLGISSKSYLHTGEIAGYTKTVKSISKVANALSKGTYLGIALDVGVGALEVQEACSTGREQQCTKAKYVEGGKAAGGIVLAWGGGSMGAIAGPALCVALGLPTGGMLTVACAVVGGAVLGWGGGKVGSVAGETTSTVLYETVYGD